MIKNLVLLLVLLLSPFTLFLIGFVDTVSKVISYSDVFSGALNQDFLFSIYISLVSTVISCLLGAYFSFLLVLKSKSHENSRLLRFIVFMPHLAFAYLLYLLISPTGFISRAVSPVLDFSNIFIVNDHLGLGIIIHYILKETAFVFLFFMSSQTIVDKNLVRTSYSLGASTAESFFKIYLPIKKSSLLAVSIIIFSYCLGSYEAPYLLGANSPKMVAVSIYENFQSIDTMQNQIAYVQTFTVFIMSSLFSLFVFTCLRSKK